MLTATWQTVKPGYNGLPHAFVNTKGFKPCCYVAVGIEVAEWVFSDKHVMSDVFGGIGVELIKAGIASALGYAAAMAVGHCSPLQPPRSLPEPLLSLPWAWA